MATTPTAIVCIGMAGSGKTTFMQRINAHLHQHQDAPYVVNLDPAVRNVPFESNIDIRDSIDYKEVMSQYNLGPNGGILTSLNLFATKVDQILDILERRAGLKPEAEGSEAKREATTKPIKNIIIDTPGQIEVFVWSASGQIILSSLASTFPTVIAYIIDTPRTASTSTFMSNMLYACSILYKTKLPMILVFNKTDAQDASFAKEWMTDFEAFQAALKREEETGVFGGLESGAPQSGPAVGGSGYMSSLLNSMSLVLEEFYKHLSVIAVSSYTGAGIDDFFDAVKDKAAEFERDYKPELERRRQARADERQGRREQDLGNLMKDLDVQGAGKPQNSKTGRKRQEAETVSDLEDDDSEPEAELVEPDTIDEGDDDEDGLGQRYKQALVDEAGDGANPAGDDFSFARYIRSSQMNG